jgi:alcohol dehydrogenase class IV
LGGQQPEDWRNAIANYSVLTEAPDALAATRGDRYRYDAISQAVESYVTMPFGAHYAGIAIEHPMLGATHACANRSRRPTARRTAWLSRGVAPRGALELDRGGIAVSRLPSRLRDLGVPAEALHSLAEETATQWTGGFNSRHFDLAAALEIYQSAY